MALPRLFLACCALAACSIPPKVAGTGDAAGSPDGSSVRSDGGVMFDAMIDAEPGAPTVTLTGMPDAVGNQSTVTFSYTVSSPTMPVTIECRVDAQPYASCPVTMKTFTGVPDGAHSFDLRATTMGKTGEVPTYSFAIDTAAPVLAITGEPADPSVMASAQFTFTIGDSVSVTCQLDAQAAAACTSPVAYTGLADGAHAFKLRGTDAAGNVAIKTYGWTIDTTPPALAITSTPAAIDKSMTSTFAFTIGDSATVTCQLDGTNPNACTSPTTYTGLAQGSHSFTLRGTDAAGNLASRSFTWSVDSVAPVVQITSGPGSPTTNKTATFGFTTNEGTTTCALDTGGFAACSSPTAYNSLADGLHLFSVKATDAAGNATTTPTYGWAVDTTPPSIGTISYTCDTTGALSVSWTVSDAVSGVNTVSCTYAGSPVNCGQTSYSGGQNPSGSVFVVTATDHVGNTSVKSKTIMLGVLCE